MNYIKTDYYYDQISSLASELIDEIEDIMNDYKDKELILNDGLSLNFNGKKLIKLIFEQDNYGDLDIALYYENGETELFRELPIDDMMTIAEFVNGVI